MFFLTLFITFDFRFLKCSPSVRCDLLRRSFIDCNAFSNATFFQLLQSIDLNDLNVARFSATELRSHGLLNVLRVLKRRHFFFIPPLPLHLLCVHRF
ncbi:hypothetical protein D7Y40_03070 [Stenotrophomonas maltophilia]|nr:hypothetical protein [Stenotrophomonas maltophilia]MBA0542984.1 hypothetical protein [Stenotrophomonas maltophilia]